PASSFDDFVLVGSLACVEERPAARAMAGAGGPTATPSRSPLLVHQRTQGVETAGRYSACCYQLPPSRLHLRFHISRSSDDIRKEGSSAMAQEVQRLLRVCTQPASLLG